MSARERKILLVAAFCALGVGTFPFVRDAVITEVAAAQPVPDRTWVYFLLAAGVLATLGGAFAWRRAPSHDWPLTVVVVATCVVAAGAAILLVPDKDIVTRAAELGYVVVNSPSEGLVRYGPDMRWTLVPFAAGAGLVVSVVVSSIRHRVRGHSGHN